MATGEIGILAVLAAAADGRLAPGARCPVSEAPVAVVKKERRETVSCPNPQNHLSRGSEGRAVTELVDGLPEGDAALASRLRGR